MSDLTTMFQHERDNHNKLKHYYKARLLKGLSAIESKHETLESMRRRRRLGMRRYHARWGKPSSNLAHKIRQENIRSGLWKEEEHPL